MSLRNRRNAGQAAKTNRRPRALVIEPLESRLLNAVDSLHELMGIAMDPSADTAAEPVPSLESSVSSLLSNGIQAPRILAASPLPAGNVLEGRSALMSIVALDDRGERNLTYQWSVVRSPSNVGVVFSKNGSNEAKQTSIGFRRAGNYEVQVRISDADGHATAKTFAFQVKSVATSLRILTMSGTSVIQGSRIASDSSNLILRANILDQFGQSMSGPQEISWSLVSGPRTGLFRSQSTASATVMNFSTPGNYVVRGVSGGLSVVFSVQVRTPAANMQVVDGQGNPITENTITRVTGTETKLRFVGGDGSSTLEWRWSTQSGPTQGTANVVMRGNEAAIQFSRAGTYVLNYQRGSAQGTVRFSVVSTLSQIEILSSVDRMTSGATQALRLQGRDQFGNDLEVPTGVWSTTGGSITADGRWTAGQPGTAIVRATVGSLFATKTFTIEAARPSPSSFQVQAIRDLVQTYYVDQSLSRAEVMQVLRSAGNDSVVDAKELADLRALVSGTTWVMPDYVRALAADVVGSNPANGRYQGKSLGNLVAGSSSTQLNQLVDKWFLGTDVPELTGSGITYAWAAGTLFPNTPGLQDARQGQLGDCYLIASLVSLANKDPQVVRDMFIDNGDGTYTVRFFATSSASGGLSADYVTVNKRLPVLGNGSLAYSGRGLYANNPGTALWIGLAEKAYAQWNETGGSGRDGTNTYRAIEGGWMQSVNTQILGVRSLNYAYGSQTQASLVNALANGLAVTTGTKSVINIAGLVAGHAYVITGFNASTNAFTLVNPWGFQHPTPLTWSQLQSNFSMFVTANPLDRAANANTKVNIAVRSDAPQGYPATPITIGMEAQTWDPGNGDLVHHRWTTLFPLMVTDQFIAPATNARQEIRGIDGDTRQEEDVRSDDSAPIPELSIDFAVAHLYLRRAF